MKALYLAGAAVVALMVLIPTTGVCMVADEICLYGHGDDRPLTDVRAYDPSIADVAIDAFLFFRIRTPAAGFSVAEREIIVLQRLVEVMSSGIIGPVYVDEVRGAPTVYVDKFRLVTVFPCDVVACRATSAHALAQQWADSIRKGLLMTAPSNCFGGVQSYSVGIGAAVFFRLVDPMGYDTVQQRGQAVDRRIAKIAASFQPSLVKTKAGAVGSVNVMYGDDILVTATPLDAHARQMPNAKALAEAWAKNLRAGLAPCFATP